MGYHWKNLCQVALVLSAFGASANGMIPSPELPFGNDTVRTPDGFQCSSAISPSSYLDAGIYQEDSEDSFERRDKGVYMRVMIPLYSGVKRLDCSALYNDALKERRREKALNDLRRDVFDDKQRVYD